MYYRAVEINVVKEFHFTAFFIIIIISLQLSTAEHRPPLKRATLFGPPLSSSSVHRRSYEYRRTSGSEVVLRYAYRDAVSTLGLVCSSGHRSYDRYGQPTATSACLFSELCPLQHYTNLNQV
ncbi:hypothetical protein O3G_MSEX009053 [Manduca sexta]|uniref:Uncharacterized protein n=1 Tax=Manduca sexta TaxID=7130 RepID=A0A922CQW2_MANSE|nr:hypothetical protein O3G_MSEX009053 [Manduca sexta]